MPIRQNFSMGQVVDPTRGLQTALSNVGTIMQQRQDAENERNKMAAAQANADRTYAMQKLASDRATSEYKLLKQQRGAMSAVGEMPANVIGQQAFRNNYNDRYDEYDQLEANMTLSDEDQKRAIEAMVPGDYEVGNEESYNEELEYQQNQIKHQNSGRSKYFDKLASDYNDVFTASGNTLGGGTNDLSLTVGGADAGYELRVYNELVANKVDPIKAKAMARQQASLYEPKPLTKLEQDDYNSQRKAILEQKKQADSIAAKKAERIRTGGYGSGGNRSNTKGSSDKNLSSFLTEMKIDPNNWTDDDQRSVFKMKDRISTTPGYEGADVNKYIEEEMRRDGWTGEWTSSSNKITAIKDLEKAVKARMITAQAAGNLTLMPNGGSSGKTTSKYGSGYDDAVTANATTASNALTALSEYYDRPGGKDTGLADLLKESGTKQQVRKVNNTQKLDKVKVPDIVKKAKARAKLKMEAKAKLEEDAITNANIVANTEYKNSKEYKALDPIVKKVVDSRMSTEQHNKPKTTIDLADAEGVKVATDAAKAYKLKIGNNPTLAQVEEYERLTGIANTKREAERQKNEKRQQERSSDIAKSIKDFFGADTMFNTAKENAIGVSADNFMKGFNKRKSQPLELDKNVPNNPDNQFANTADISKVLSPAKKRLLTKVRHDKYRPETEKERDELKELFKELEVWMEKKN